MKIPNCIEKVYALISLILYRIHVFFQGISVILQVLVHKEHFYVSLFVFYISFFLVGVVFVGYFVHTSRNKFLAANSKLMNLV